MTATLLRVRGDSTYLLNAVWSDSNQTFLQVTRQKVSPRVRSTMTTRSINVSLEDSDSDMPHSATFTTNAQHHDGCAAKSQLADDEQGERARSLAPESFEAS